MNWTLFDFLLAGGMLAILAAALVFFLRAPVSLAYRAGIMLTAFTALALFWVTGAVGLIGSESHDANLAYLALIALAGLGALAVRFQASGLSRVMLVAALAQALIGLAALVLGLGADGPAWPWDVALASAAFTGLWAGAALFFRRAHSPAKPA